MTPTIYKFITQEDGEYQEGVALRITLFFKGMPNAVALIDDDYEHKALHLVAVKNHEVVGTGRLHFIKNTAIISQMTVAPAVQKQKIGQHILQTLIKKSKTQKITKITLSARVTALNFYSKFGFKAIKGQYPSTKTGIIHQHMEMPLK